MGLQGDHLRLRCGLHQGCRGISGTHFYYSRDDIIQHVCVVYFAYVSDAIRRVENNTKFALFLFYLLSFYFNSPCVNFKYFFRHKMCSKVYAVVNLACSDDGIGKFDRSMLSQQELMELFIFGLNEPEKICGSRKDLDDVCAWKGVTCYPDGEVEEFHWINKNENGTGSLGFEFLPCSMNTLYMFMNALSGTIQLGNLPCKIEAVNLSVNQLTGSLDLDRLPATVRSLFLTSNKFTGEVSLENLPICLKFLELSENLLSGAVCLNSLPTEFSCLCLQKNDFEGSLDFTQLPKFMKVMDLSENRFSGRIDLRNLPDSMVRFNVRNNVLSGTVRVPEQMCRKFNEDPGACCFGGNQ